MAVTLRHMVDVFKCRSICGNSHEQHDKHWRQWRTWCLLMQMPIILTKQDTNANTAQIGAFAVYCFYYGMNTKNKGNQHGTIASKISAIRWRHRFLVGYEPEVDAGYRLLMRGIKCMLDPVAKKHPLTNKMLRRLHQAIDWSQPKQQMLWGAVLLAYFFLL